MSLEHPVFFLHGPAMQLIFSVSGCFVGPVLSSSVGFGGQGPGPSAHVPRGQHGAGLKRASTGNATSASAHKGSVPRNCHPVPVSPAAAPPPQVTRLALWVAADGGAPEGARDKPGTKESRRLTAHTLRKLCPHTPEPWKSHRMHPETWHRGPGPAPTVDSPRLTRLAPPGSSRGHPLLPGHQASPNKHPEASTPPGFSLLKTPFQLRPHPGFLLRTHLQPRPPPTRPQSGSEGRDRAGQTDNRLTALSGRNWTPRSR